MEHTKEVIAGDQPISMIQHRNSNTSTLCNQHEDNPSPDQWLKVPIPVTSTDLTDFDPRSEACMAMRRKVDRRLIPMLALIYLLCFLDRANIGNAKIAGIEQSLNLKPGEFNMALSIFYIGYVIGEVPSNMMLRKFGPRKWIPIVIFLWGTIMMAMAAVKSAAGLYASRFFLGLAEAGYAPAPVFVISLWYIRSEQAIRIGLFFSAATVAGAFGGLLAYAITRMEGILGLTGWQWIFIIEGFLTIIASVVAYFRLPDLPSKATFLTPDEKQLALQRLEFDSGHVQDTTFSRKQFYSAFVDWRVYFFMAIGLLHHVSFAALGLFIPSIVRGFGYDAVTTQIMTVPIYAIACLFTLTAAFSADRNKERGLHIVAASFFSAIGYLILILTRHSLTAARYTGLVICTSGMYAFIPCFLSWPAANIAGATKRGVAIALVISISHIGSITGGQLYRSDDAPLYKRGHIVSASTMVLVGLLALILRSILKRENKRRERLSPQEYMVECDKVDQAEDHPGFRFYT